MIYAIVKIRGMKVQFAVETDVQSEVENFMLSLGLNCRNYYLSKTDKSSGMGKNWLLTTPVKVKYVKNKGYRFTIY